MRHAAVNNISMFVSEEKTQEFFQKFLSTDKVFQRQIAAETVHKTNHQQVVIGHPKRLPVDDCLEYLKADKGDIHNLFYCVAYPNLECDVCFDHPLDHYPLMMIFEIGRQLGIAASHKIHDIPMQGFITIVDFLSFEFGFFLELDKPLYVVCIESAVKQKKGTLRRHMDLAFVQEGIHCASGAGDVSAFSTALYKRMRMASRNKIAPATQGSILTNRDILADTCSAAASTVK